MKRLNISTLVSSWRERRWLVGYLWLGVVEGVLISLYLLTLPSDPENRIFLNLTRSRLLVLLTILLPTLFVLCLAVKSLKDLQWSRKWSGMIMDNRSTIPHLSVVLLVILLLAVSLIVLFRAEDFVRLNQAYLVRLAPPLIWLGLLLGQLCLIWLWIWKRHEISIPQWTWDVLAAGVLFFVALWPRIEMTAYALPYQSVWDEVVIYSPALNLLTTPGLKPSATVPGYGHAAYGDLVTYIATGGELLGLFDGLRAGNVSSVQEYVAPPNGVKSTFSAVNTSGLPLQVPRMVFAFLNSLAPVGIYIALRKELQIDRGSAFGGGFIFAILSRDVLYYSSYMLPDSLTATLFIFLLIAAWRSMRDESDHLGIFLLSGVLAGMMVSLTIRVLLVVLVPPLALFFSRNKQRFFAKFFVSIAGIAGGFLLTSPYALLDLPSFLTKVTSLTWSYDLSLANRLAGLVYYIQGAFKPGFNSLYVDSSAGSVGLGLAAGLLAVVGIGRLLLRYPRHAILMLVIATLHLFIISSIQQRYTRHALVLYPVVCIFAGAGLGWLVEGAQAMFERLVTNKSPIISTYLVRGGIPALILTVFLIISAHQLSLTLRYIYRTHNYKVPQVQAAEFLSSHTNPGDKVGILDDLPWVENDLEARGIYYVRIPASDTLEELKAKQVTLVAGTDRFGGDYAQLTGTIWENSFKAPGVKLAEFGVGSLLYDGYPAGQLYIFVARVP